MRMLHARRAESSTSHLLAMTILHLSLSLSLAAQSWYTSPSSPSPSQPTLASPLPLIARQSELLCC